MAKAPLSKPAASSVSGVRGEAIAKISSWAFEPQDDAYDGKRFLGAMIKLRDLCDSVPDPNQRSPIIDMQWRVSDEA